MGRRSKILQSTYIDGQETHEKMLNITDYQRNENQNYNEVSPHPGQNSHHQKSPNDKCWRGCGEKGIVHGVTMSWTTEQLSLSLFTYM